MKGLWPITMMCEVLEVSPSGYFSWCAAQRGTAAGPSRFLSDEALLAHMRAIHDEIGGEYGWPRMHKQLLARGLRAGKERVRQLMQRHGIRAKGRRKFVVTTDSAHRLPVSPDLVQRQFTPAAPNMIWSGDITYIPTDEGWLYLAAVLELHSRQVVGWNLQAHMQTSLVKDALLMACFRRRQVSVGRSWRMDEAHVRVGGRRMYLYRAVDRLGQTVDFLLTAKRDEAAARRFFVRAIDGHDEPEKVTSRIADRQSSQSGLPGGLRAHP